MSLAESSGQNSERWLVGSAQSTVTSSAVVYRQLAAGNWFYLFPLLGLKCMSKE